VVCPHCQRTSRAGETCEWCQRPLEAAASEPAVPETEATVTEVEEVEAAESVAETAAPVSGIKGVLARAGPWVERLDEYGVDRYTLPILLLMLFHMAVSLARGGVSLYSLPVALWAVVGVGLAQRQMWSAALALLLVCTEIAFALFGVAPEKAFGLPYWAPIDFLMMVTRIVNGFLVWHLRDQFE
jgi:hypothetical protein